MKRILSAALALVLLILLSVTVIAVDDADISPTVYLSDNGDDSKSGSDSENAVKTIEKAFDILGSSGGVIIIPDVYTYPGTGSYYMKYTEGASYVIRGMKDDGSSRFVHGRKNMVMNNPIVFDNLTYELSNTWCLLFANFNRLEFTETVTMKPYNDVDERNNYLFVYGGMQQGSGKSTQNVELVLNGGKFGYIVAGCQKAEMYGKATVTVGENANIVNRIYMGPEGTPGDIYGEVTLNLNGGTVGDYIYCGGAGESSYVSGNMTLNIKGGTFKGITCHGSAGGELLGALTIDMSDYEPAVRDSFSSKVIDAPENAKIYYYGEKASEDEPGETDSSTDTDTGNETETGNETDTFEEATDESVNYNTDNSETTAEETNTKGCKSSVKGCTAAIVLISIFTALGIKKKEY